jgi:PAS domain S-box-containing protein
MVFVTLAYVLAGKIGLGFASIHVSASPVWAPAGMAVACFLLFGFSLWPAIVVGAFLVNVTTAGTVLTSGSIAIGNTLEGLLGAFLVQQFAHGLRAFESPGDVFKFSILAGMLSPTVSATIGVTTLTWSGLASLAQYPSIWLTWWLGDAVGILILAPALILWVQHPRIEWKTGEGIELVLLMLVLFLSCGIIFGVDAPKHYPVGFLLVPVLIWAAFRFSPRETVTLSIVLAGWAAWGTMNGRGPFTGDSENEALLLSQAFLAVNTVMALALAAGVQERMAAETERKHAEEALRQSEERFRTLADNISQFAWTADATGWINWYNRRWYEYTGSTLDEMQGWGWEKVHHPDHIDRVVAKWKRAQATGEAWEDTFPLRSSQGEYRWFLSRALPIRDADGQIVRWFGTNTDVSDQRTAEEALRERERFLSTVTSAARVGLVVVGPGYVYRFANAAYADIFHLSLGGIVGRHVYDLLPDGWPQIQPRLDRAFMGERVSYELTLPAGATGNGQDSYSVSYEPHLAQTGERTVVVVVVDITNRKRAEEALRDNQERLRSFAGQLEELVSARTEALEQSEARLRELATELNLTEQRERKRLATDLHDHLAQMLALGRMKLAQTQRIPDLVPKCLELIKETDDVLSQSLTYTRTLVADLSPPVLFDLGLGPALTWLGEQMRHHGLSVTVHNSIGRIQLSEEQTVLLFQSVRELLINVAKYAQCPQATVRVTQDHRHLRIQVQDAGMGFDPTSTAQTAGPSKFGLFSIRERMRALDGLFEIHSAPGKGTLATLTLALEGKRTDSTSTGIMSPEPSDVSKSSNEPPGTSQLTHAARRISVLLVDDHAMVRQGLRTVLESYPDIDVIGEAWNGEEAVAFVEQRQPSIVLMDINMPKMNGIEATESIKSRYPEIIIIGLSVNAGSENSKAMAKAGASALLTKESAVDQLYQAIVAETVGSS